MIVSWISPDAQEARFPFACEGCGQRIEVAEPIYMAKRHGKTIKLCEECAANVEVDREVTHEDRENWLGEM